MSPATKKPLEVRLFDAMGDALVARAHQAEKAGEDDLFPHLTERARECYARAQQLERILADPNPFTDPDYSSCCAALRRAPSCERETAHVR